MTPSHLRDRLSSSLVWMLAGALGLSVGEGLVTGSAIGEALGGFGDRLAGFYVTAALVALVALPAAVLGALAIAAPSTHRLAVGLRQGLGGACDDSGRPGYANAAVVAGLMLLGVSLIVGTLAGRWLIPRMSAPFAAAGTALCTLVGLTLALPLGALTGRVMGSALHRIRDRRGGALLAHPATLAFLLSAGLAVVLLRLLPGNYAPASVTAVLMVSAALVPRIHAPGRAIMDRRAGWIGVGMVWLCCLPAPWVLEAANQGVQAGVMYAPPHLGFGVRAAHSLSDGDGDGYGTVLMGGDCDDGDPNVYPSAPEILDNGVDENCSGRDAQAYVPPPEPSFKRAPGLAKRLNIVLVQIDALRPDRMGFAGYSRKLTPKLDAFRKESTWFRNAYTPAPSTRFAMASLFTGRDPTLIPQRGGAGNSFRMLPAAKSVTERLRKEARYDTFGLTISYVIHHNKGMGQGFRVWKTPWPVNDYAKIYGKAAPITTAEAVKYLKTRPTGPKASPWLLFTHYRCPHDPYTKHKEWDFGNAAKDRYDSSIAYCDRHIGRLLETLKKRPDWDRTAVVLFSDHGELFGEHGYKSHGNTLYEPDVRSLLLARVPGASVSTVDVPVRLTDLGPTMLDLAQAKRFKASDGWSLLPLFYDEPPQAWRSRPLYLYTRLVRGAAKFEASGIVQWPYKAIRDHLTGHRYLFHLEDDPGERRNLADQSPDRMTHLMELLDVMDSRPRP